MNKAIQRLNQLDKKGWVNLSKEEVKEHLAIKEMMNPKQFIKDFEAMKDNAELNALSKISLERPLSDLEFKKFKDFAEAKLRSCENGDEGYIK